MPLDKEIIDEIKFNFPNSGKVNWIGLRPAPKKNLIVVDQVYAEIGKGLEGDRFDGDETSKRQVTLIQQEHLNAVATFIKTDKIDPSDTRRNIVVEGLNLLGLVEKKFKIGEAVFEGSSYCTPCSRMEENLGKGGFNAMQGHGGITARVIKSGVIKLNDPVQIIENQ
ncbi:MAG: MOSC domain-containing protein [Melioribacteraceae bacterium]|nr:MOSC domain-containing protein [Melioribacteraceae bacterium]